ncbi:hypothetical protein ABZX40_11850 [Streptomyces sp. NPDC004610]|uniref:hypothetical protein n=1 Tax=unclassified Streptomyces TaxID=2593676 RepID=UPI0033B8C59F
MLAIPVPSDTIAPLAVRLVSSPVQVGRLLAQKNLAALEPELAAALSWPGDRLSPPGRRTDALATAQEAVWIHHRLAAGAPPHSNPFSHGH